MIYNDPKFRTKRGYLTVYAFACGYIERRENESIRVSLYLDGCWHVTGANSRGRIFWDCFETYKEARAGYNARLKEYGLKRGPHMPENREHEK